ncbi:response regulator transcription factor [Paenibacillus sp. D2_2]|uniref:response regulator transcription factor n=1 Tax=Paenibacillus sp. D2_2 TaxID=3073092 RepID=UPI0028151FEB|nr:response regulator transcription factor [Paenibacillus sp. D2_2]WMT41420.1 response regulator transcription factor [Paenibacillus sp. D2_2]
MFKVFLVDDEPFIIEGLYDIVDWAELGMEIVGQAGNGLEAFEALKHIPADILVTDISMPKMNGLDLIRQIRESQPELKVIVLSGFNEFDYLKEGMMLGIENYLLKPINIEEFKATLNTVAEKLNASRRSLNDLSEQSIMILKDHIMYRWIRNQINPQEFQERADLLGIHLDKHYVLVSLLRSKESSQSLFDAVLHQLWGKEGVIPFCDMEGNIVLVYNFDDLEEGLEEAKLMNQQLMGVLLSFRPLQMAIGSIQEMEEEPFLSYTHAKKAQEYFMIYPEQDILHYDQLKDHQDNAERSIPMNWSEYSKLIMARDTAGLIAHIDEDFGTLRQVQGISPRLLQELAMEWIIRFKMQLEEIRHDEEADLYKDQFARIRTTFSVEELVQIMYEVVEITVESLTNDMKSPVVQQVLHYIDQSYNEDISLKTLGALYHIHPVYLGQLFHKEVNQSFTDYINWYRIEKAKELLKHSPMKVQEIARGVGYWETGYFYKQFKKYVGISPTEYKGLS